jgi:hypothetical protein
MEYVAVLLLVITIAIIASFMQASVEKPKEHSNQITVQKKQCPPHSWFFQEIVDQDGNKQGERIVCKVCGPLSASLDGSIE